MLCLKQQIAPLNINCKRLCRRINYCICLYIGLTASLVATVVSGVSNYYQRIIRVQLENNKQNIEHEDQKKTEHGQTIIIFIRNNITTTKSRPTTVVISVTTINDQH